MLDLDYYTCYTLFDITSTAVIGTVTLPFKDAAGQAVVDDITWERSRNQQRNWDTMLQIVSMRAQPMAFSKPKVIDTDDHCFVQYYSGKHRIWSFTFGVEAREVFRKGSDPVWTLQNDSKLVPMSVGLTETANLSPACILPVNTQFKLSNVA
jgi:hypothetical protein